MAFGAVTDHFGYADTNWRLQSASKDPRSENATAEDSFGDVACETVFDTGHNYEAVYEVIKGDTGNNVEWPATLKGGTIVGGIAITSANIETSQTEKPRVTVSGEDIGAADSTGFATYSWVLPTIKARKQAQAMGFTPAAGARVTSASMSCSVEMAATQDSLGNRVAADVYNGRQEVSGEMVACDTIADASADTDWTLNGPLGNSEENTDYGTSTINVFRNIGRDT